MNITAADVVTILMALGALYTAWSNGRKNKVESEKAQAEAVKSYAETAALMSEKWQGYEDCIHALEEKLAALAGQINSRDTKIRALERKVGELTVLLESKDQRIDELEKLTAGQECEIKRLRGEIEDLRKQQRG